MRQHFHIWESGDRQVFSPIEAVIGYLRNEHRKTISDLSHERCFAVLDAIGVLCDLENGRQPEYLGLSTKYPQINTKTR